MSFAINITEDTLEKNCLIDCLLHVSATKMNFRYNIGYSYNKYTITGTSNSGFWNTPAVNGESYLLQVNAFSYDAEANQTNYIYNVSEISIGESQIEWGVN
jgi:hypothetical protein